MSGTRGKHDGAGIKNPSAWRAKLITKPESDEHTESLTVIRILPKMPRRAERWWERTCEADVDAQCSTTRDAVKGRVDPNRTIAVAPSGWLKLDTWPLPRPRKLLEGIDEAINHNAATLMPKLGDLVVDRLGESLGKLPVRYVFFGVDFRHDGNGEDYEWVLEGLFVFERKNIVHSTTKFAQYGGSAAQRWLLASRKWSTHVCKLDLLGRTALLACHDLASLTQKRVAVDKLNEPLKKRFTEMKRVMTSQKLNTLIHIAHTLGTRSTWRSKHSAFLRDFGGDLAATAGRYAAYKRPAPPYVKSDDVAAYSGLATGFRDIPVLLIPS